MISADRRLIVAALAIVAGGCIKFGTRPPLERYRLEIPEPGAMTSLQGSSTALLPGSIAVQPYAVPGLYGRDPIVYRIGETFDAYPNREWAIPLRDQLGGITARLLEARPLTSQRVVYDPQSRRSYTFAWQGRVLRFEEVNRGDTVLAAVGLEAQLVRTADDSVIWSGRYQDERAVPPPNTTMEPIIHVLSVLTAEAITGLIDSARVQLRVAAVESARIPP